MAPDLPRIFLLQTHLPADELQRIEERIPTLTHDIHEADVVLGKISRPERALFELRRLKLSTEPVSAGEIEGEVGHDGKRPREDASELPSKRPRLSESKSRGIQEEESSSAALNVWREPKDAILVLKLAWLLDSLQQDVALPVDDYLLYRGRKLPSQPPKDSALGTSQPGKKSDAARQASAVFARAAEDRQGVNDSSYSQRAARQLTSSPKTPSGRRRAEPPKLYHESTSDHDAPLPPIPDFLHTTYSCQRPSLVSPPNAEFIKELKDIRTLRLLQGDQIGVRAYSTSIASLAAYPYLLQRPQGGFILCLLSPSFLIQLYQQWATAGRTEETRAAATDTELAVMNMFYNIWGVADATARQFYKRGWRDLDDIVEHGWNSLTRVQQIGVKYYDEFQLKIPRAETEAIANVVLTHARRIDPGFQMVIVGSYRRGKPVSGDVDVVLSHPDEAQTLDVIVKILSSLEKSSFVTHTLSVWTRNSERGQAPLPWRGPNRSAGSGFDTLDKAMVVWQNPEGDGGQAAQGPAPHRRVDIIISPWKTAGCAVLGWSGETTFQRDLRRYCKAKLGFKFDSSGVRTRADGSWVDLEGAERGPAPDMETAEKRVFEGLDLEWRPPAERCTG
ncbi:dna polymerase beta [Trichoderma arundinaceum]|uniref:DNA polymerase n=1 Tax=Trichoderma arundinaceum TaxID=490622 RepID=A0A395NXP5_TRIAR|nr:dna polymerase beta [Trichoderma arundinaceum]